MASPDVSIRIKAETELEQARFDAQRAFGRIEEEAVDAARGIEDEFERAGREVGSSFEDVRAEISGELGRLEGDAADAASGIEGEFDRSADRLPGLFDGVRARISSSWSRLGADARDAGSEIESGFERGADGIPRRFSRVRGDLKGEFSKIEADAEGAAGGVAESFSGIAGQIDLSDIGGTLAGGMQEVLGRGGPVLAAVGAGAAVLGDELADGFTDGFGRRRSDISTEIRTGLDSIDVADAGRVAGEAYAAGFGEGVADLRFEVAAVRKEFQDFDLGADELEITKQMQLLADQFGIEIPQQIEVARRAVANGLAPDITSALEGIFQLARELPRTFDDGLGSLDDYASTFGGLNVSMEQFVNLLAVTERSGAFETTDKVGESIRELNTRLTETDELRDPIGRLGLDFAALQAQLARGDIVGVLLAIDGALEGLSTREQNLALGEIFGSSFEDVTDRGRALDDVLRGLTGTLDGYGTGLEEATQKQEAAVGGFQRLQREVTTFTDQLGTAADSGLDQFFTRTDSVQDKVDEFTDSLLRSVGLMEEADEVTSRGGRSLEGLGRIVSRGGRSFEDLGEASRLAADGLDETAESIDGVRAELDELLNFSADQLMRNIADAADDLEAQLAETDTSLIGLNGAIRIGTEEGRNLQAAFEGLAEQQSIAAQRFAEGEITAGEYRQAQAEVASELDRVTGAAGLTTSQVQGLIDKYGLVPDDVETILRAKDEASGTLSAIRSAILGIPTSRTITVTTLRRASAGPNSPFFKERADGGPTRGLTLVGEEGVELAEENGRVSLVGVDGPELIDFPGLTNITSHAETMRLLSNRIGNLTERAAAVRSTGTRSASPISTSGGRDGPLINIENWNVSDGRDSAADLRTVEAVYRMAAA